ncbi:hypothetical protein TH66_05265 [Carbonactinospora thermoautotrophica]|uniref:Uncharacterized protein n=1 Tax=Carbonactinospora thermoautotrophica TaxID=1469144 RepID=A0A132NGX1_9ACTN|nr:hypothetical protein [Carbonactinospora thermoautotrophica]KWW99043.1 hypothetical protein LI90_675 [Carbonactinospora thermoautotrophica]KWX05129.1 hypothetical protein TH66_05265 [Carbonactinospora thermoautotrophica]KWX09361.1 hypothetical protein TR74_10045 [Carbonactinospora thermoautotrophica]
MPHEISFHVDDDDPLNFRASERVKRIGYWLTSDIQESHYYCLALLMDIAGFLEGRQTEPSEWSGNAWLAIITPETVTLSNHWNEDLGEQSWPLAEVYAIVRKYWEHLRDFDPERARQAVREYEEETGTKVPSDLLPSDA